MSSHDLTKPTRQELRGFLVIFAFEAIKLLRGFWPLFILLFAQKNQLPEGLTIPVILGLSLLILIVHTCLFYLNFYFYIDNSHFVLKKGYLRKKVLNIPLQRIQSVNTKQNILQQMLKVFTLEIDTAGSVNKELKIYSLSGTDANHLTEFLQSKKEYNKDGTSTTGSVKDGGDVILKLTPSDLFRIGISENHLRTALIIFVFGSQVIRQMQDLFKVQTDAYSDSVNTILATSGIIFYTFLGFLFIAILILATLIITYIKYFDFKLVKQQQSYSVTAGLLNKRKVLLPFNKVQQLNWETGPIKKLFGIFKVTFKQAVSKQVMNKQVADAPGCLHNHIESIRNELFDGDFPDQTEKIYAHPRYFKMLWFQRGWLPALLPVALYIYEPKWLIAGVLWLVLSGLYNYLKLRKRYFQFNGNQLIVGKGAINTEWQQTELFKTQTVDFRQSFYQKRKGLASLRVNNASGQMIIPYIHEEMAYKLMNYLIYHIEVSKKKWM